MRETAMPLRKRSQFIRSCCEALAAGVLALVLLLGSAMPEGGFLARPPKEVEKSFSARCSPFRPSERLDLSRSHLVVQYTNPDEAYHGGGLAPSRPYVWHGGSTYDLPVDCTEFVLSADGSSMAYRRWTEKTVDMRVYASAIYVSNRDGSGAMQLTDGVSFDSDLTISPDGKQIAFVRESKNVMQRPGEEPLIFVVSHSGQEQKLTIGHSPSWSPSGEWIAFLRQNDLHLIRPEGTMERVIANAVQSFAWSPDGQYLVFSTQGILLLLDVHASLDGPPSKLLQGNYPVWSPDGCRIAFVQDKDVRILDLATRHTLLVIKNTCNPVWSPDGQRLALMERRDLTNLHGSSGWYVLTRSPISYVIDFSAEADTAVLQLEGAITLWWTEEG